MACTEINDVVVVSTVGQCDTCTLRSYDSDYTQTIAWREWYGAVIARPHMPCCYMEAVHGTHL